MKSAALIVLAMASASCGPVIAQTSASERQICRATIAALNGREPSIMQIDGAQGPVVFVSYVRPSDGSLWVSKCRVQGTRVMWGNRDGRWRDHAMDEVVEYRATGAEVIITIKSNGQVSATKTYAVKDLGQ